MRTFDLLISIINLFQDKYSRDIENFIYCPPLHLTLVNSASFIGWRKIVSMNKPFATGLLVEYHTKGGVLNSTNHFQDIRRLKRNLMRS